MVQILPENKRLSTADRFAQAFSNLGQASSQTIPEFLRGREQKQSISNLLGPEYENLPPEFQQLALQSQLRQQEMGQKLQGESEIEGRDYDVVKGAFGEKFANLWRSQPIGARTELIKNGIEAKQRGIDLEEMLQSFPDENIDRFSKNEPSMGKEKPEWPDFTKPPEGYTPKDWREERKLWRQENAPIFAENAKKLQNVEKDMLSGKALTKINESKKLPEGLERLLINPDTGDFYGPAEVLGFKSPEAQEWSKIIAQFQNRAKDAFGSRVTNFDLQSYMKQFPGLLNTYEGRKRILRMMDINWKLDKLYLDEKDKIYKKYNLNGIPQEAADDLAAQRVQDKAQKLREEFLELDNANQEEQNRPAKLSGKMIDVIGPNGEDLEVDESEVGMLPEGYRIK